MDTIMNEYLMLDVQTESLLFSRVRININSEFLIRI